MSHRKKALLNRVTAGYNGKEGGEGGVGLMEYSEPALLVKVFTAQHSTCYGF